MGYGLSFICLRAPAPYSLRLDVVVSVFIILLIVCLVLRLARAIVCDARRIVPLNMANIIQLFNEWI